MQNFKKRLVIELLLLIVTRRLEDSAKLVGFLDVCHEYNCRFGVPMGVQTPRYYEKQIIRVLFNKLIHRRLVLSSRDRSKSPGTNDGDFEQFSVQVIWTQILNRMHENAPMDINEYARNAAKCD
ncbi:hypothetical protein ACOME3_002920 [Neoechinorhynchus agilis]